MYAESDGEQFIPGALNPQEQQCVRGVAQNLPRERLLLARRSVGGQLRDPRVSGKALAAGV